jgi:tartrate/fumarate subfamily iron-sulfur-dependent hydro-lyase beta chain
MVISLGLNTPRTSDELRSLKAGDIVSLSGTIVTGRDRVHKYLVEQRPRKEDIPFDLNGAVLYHCGPVMKKTDEGYKAVAAGPTTSLRVEMYEATVIREYGIRGVIGKGGMGPRTLEALQQTGAVYFHTVGGAAAYLADRIPAIVTMDSHGNNIHREIESASFQKFMELIK